MYANAHRTLVTLRRLAPRVGRWSLFLKSIYEEVKFRPGNQGAVWAREVFECLSAKRVCRGA
eukprot:1042066-Prymnesium_polylepis.1